MNLSKGHDEVSKGCGHSAVAAIELVDDVVRRNCHLVQSCLNSTLSRIGTGKLTVDLEEHEAGLSKRSKMDKSRLVGTEEGLGPSRQSMNFVYST